MQARDFFDEPPHEAAPQPARAPRSEPSVETPAPARAPAPALPVSNVVFHAVSEHDAVADEAHKPVRRRRHEPADGESDAPTLQMVETQPNAPVAPAVQEDELPRRTRPRKRRGGQAVDEPLMLVETQGSTEGNRPDSQP
jgi:hypothetical protein